MKRKIGSCYAGGILIFGWAYWFVPFILPIPDTGRILIISRNAGISLTGGEYADDFSPSGLIKDTVMRIRYVYIRARHTESAFEDRKAVLSLR